MPLVGPESALRGGVPADAGRPDDRAGAGDAEHPATTHPPARSGGCRGGRLAAAIGVLRHSVIAPVILLSGSLSALTASLSSLRWAPATVS